MENKYWVIQKITCDPNQLKSTEGMFVVTFNVSVLDKYKDNPDYVINTPKNVGTLKSKQGWQLQIDVHEEYVNTWLYKMGSIPEDEQAHFARYNIPPPNSLVKLPSIDGQRGCLSNS